MLCRITFGMGDSRQALTRIEINSEFAGMGESDKGDQAVT